MHEGGVLKALVVKRFRSSLSVGGVPNAAQASLSRPHRKAEQKTTSSILGELQNFVSDIRGDYIATREKNFSMT
jgi:hypothetical protein